MSEKKSGKARGFSENCVVSADTRQIGDPTRYSSLLSKNGFQMATNFQTANADLEF